MDDTFFMLIFVALTIGLLIWGLSQFFFAKTGNSDHKKLQERLAGEIQPAEAEQAFKAIRRDLELTGASVYLVRLPGMRGIHHAVEQTWPDTTLAKFLGIAAGMAAGSFVLAGAFFYSLLLGTAAGLLAGVLPFMVLSMRRSKRQQMLADQLPEALDFLGRILRAGHSLATGLQMVGKELAEPLAGEFRRTYDAHSLGRSLEDALKETTLRIGSTDFSFFVTAVLIQRQTGGDLAEVLDNIATMIRGRLRIQQNVKAKTAEGRFTGYILTAFPVIMFLLTYMFNPTYAGVLLSGTGLYLLCAAGAMCIFGLILIRKITTVKV